MEKTKVVIASILKPIDDTRMFEKFGLSLAKTNKYEVNIIGFASKNVKPHDSIKFHSLGYFSRLSWTRFQARFKVYKTYLKVKPHIIIVNSHELLIVTIFYRILFGAKILYDIRENYFKNILNTSVYPRLMRPFLATWVRFKELLSRPFFNGYLLAERVYQRQLPFIPKKAVVIENKYQPLRQTGIVNRPQKPDTLDLVYSGTISRDNGAFEAIDIASALHTIDSSVRLTIVGYCALKGDLKELQEAIEDKDFITLVGGDYLVPHTTIVKEIADADFGFVLKKPNNGINDDKILTRLFEYTAHHLPIIMLNNPTWTKFCDQFNAAIPIDPVRYDVRALHEQMTTGTFYNKGDTQSSLWETEEPYFLQVISSFHG